MKRTEIVSVFTALVVTALASGCGAQTDRSPGPTTPENQSESPGGGINGRGMTQSSTGAPVLGSPDAGPR